MASAFASVFLALALAAASPAKPGRQASPAVPTIRVGLLRLFSGAREVVVRAPAGVSLADAGGRVVGEGPAEWRLSAASGSVALAGQEGAPAAASPRFWTTAAPNAIVAVSASGARRPVRYRGSLEVAADQAAGALRLVNEVDLEAYLRGVVPCEMPTTAPPEALKSQAVAARSYAVRSMGRYRSGGFDVTDTTACQVYGGVDAEKPATDAAVTGTAGLVLRRGSAVVLADYYDDCGGVTSGGEQDGDYPPSVTDAPPDGPDYCAGGRYHSWSLRLTPSELGAALGRTVRQAVGTVEGVEVRERDASGRARTVAIVGQLGEREMRGYQFRSALGTERLRSTLFEVVRDDDGAIRFVGHGWGHGHGLCQMGAIGMAAVPHNKTFREILEHYFPGARVVPVAVSP